MSTCDKKILCTLGPSSMSPRIINKLDDMGVDIFRINLSHTPENQVEKTILQIRSCTDKPICIDTEGAQIRNGMMLRNKVKYSEGDIVVMHKKSGIGDTLNLYLRPGHIIDELQIGDLISIDFDSLLLKVCEKNSKTTKAEVISAGTVGNNKAVTVDRTVTLSPLSDKDKVAIKIALKHNVEYVALSFAGKKKDVTDLRKMVGKNMKVISKIESSEGLNNLDDILSATDSILIDRGDLSREEPVEMIPFLQKQIIKRAKQKKIPVYVATNLLESMVNQKAPTRAEVNDVVNTLMDGADGLVLAAETAIGKYAVECLVMIRKLIKAYKSFASSKSITPLLDRERNRALTLVDPHGGNLVNCTRYDVEADSIKKMKKISVDRNVLIDAEQIAIGTYSPVRGFMVRSEIEKVLDKYKLPNGVIWTLPIVFQTDKKNLKNLKIGDTVALSYERDNCVYAILHIEDIYDFDFEDIAKRWYGTDDLKHPGVKALKENGQYFLGGKIELVKRLDNKFRKYTLTPKQTRHIFEKKGWHKIVGFHTRNAIHRVHEYLQLSAMKKYNIDGLFAHPIIGPKKKSDFQPEIILKSYEIMADKFYPNNKVMLAAFMTFSRYAGPREAVFTALCRKNFGCTHFIVGRDHTGVHEFYEPDASRKLFEKIGDIGIKPVFFDEVHYCKNCKKYVESCVHGRNKNLKISGTQARTMFKEGKTPPEWFMRKDVSRMISEEIKKGNKVFV